MSCGCWSINLLADISSQTGANIVPVKGDISQEGLGLSPEDRKRLCKDVSVVFHSAATVRFVEPLTSALNVNMGGTKRVVDLCLDMEQLKSLVYVSTAYSNCPHSDIEEKLYPPPLNTTTLEKVFKQQVVGKDVIGQWPNTYSFSKAMAEHTISANCVGLPVAIVRPSIVYGSYEDPLPGWITPGGAGPYRMNQPISTGQQGFTFVDGSKVADIVPVDMTANVLIAAAWDTATQERARSGPRVYNFVSGPQNPITWAEYFDYLRAAVLASPPSDAVRPYHLTLVKNATLYYTLTFFLEILPAYFKDALTFRTGKQRTVERQRRNIKYSTLTCHFMMREWKFHNENVQNILSRMTKEDKRIFNFDVATIDWRQYMKDCYHGTRQYLNRDPLNTIPDARKRYNRLRMAQWMTQSSLLVMSLGLCTWGMGYL